MKTKEVIQLAVGLIILAIVGVLIFGAATPAKKAQSKNHTYEVITPIAGSYDTNNLNALKDSSKARDFYVKPDLRNGIGNPQPFNPLN